MQRYYFLPFLLCAGWLVATSGCAKDIPGIDPPQNVFFFPSGLRLSPSGKTLFVTNGNSDLRYNGSTLLALDAERMHRMARSPLSYANCAKDAQENDQFLCQLDSDLVRLAVRLGSYAGNMAILPTPPGSDISYRLMVSVRSDPSLTLVDVYEDENGRVTCLDCGAGCDAKWPRDCKKSHKIGISQGLPTDPFRIMVDPDTGYAVVTHLTSPMLTVVDTLMEPPAIVEVFNSRLLRNPNGFSGSYEAVMGPDDFPTVYVTNSYTPEIAWYRWQYSPDNDMETLVQAGNMYLQSPIGPLESGAELRGMAFSSDGTRLFAAVRYAPMLLVFDVTEDVSGRRLLNPVETIETFAQPALVQVNSDAMGRELVFVTSFPEGEVLVIDPDLGTWVQRIPVGTGTHEILFLPPSVFPGFYAVNFADGTLSLVSHEGDSWRRVGRFGTPRQIGKD